LLWFGAGTSFEGAYRSGRDQARVAIAGPAASLAFAFVLVAGALLPSPHAVQDGIFGLALLNVAIAAGFFLARRPLPRPNPVVREVVGGVVWRLSGSKQRATTIVRRIGKGWLVLEGIGCAVLAVERPVLGCLAVTLATVLYAQQRLTRRTRIKPIGNCLSRG